VSREHVGLDRLHEGREDDESHDSDRGRRAEDVEEAGDRRECDTRREDEDDVSDELDGVRLYEAYAAAYRTYRATVLHDDRLGREDEERVYHEHGEEPSEEDDETESDGEGTAGRDRQETYHEEDRRGG